MTESAEIKSIGEFIEVIEAISCGKGTRSEVMFLFRGQKNDWDLLPKIGRLTGYPSDIILSKEKEIIKEFKRCSRPYLQDKFSNDWDWLAMAQHYGLRTRLLDWTQNPLVALWFACIPEYENANHKRTIWSFPVKESYFASIKNNPFDLTKTMVFRPNHITKRIIAQNGWFTAHKLMIEKSKFIPLNKNANYINIIIKVVIPEKLRNGILNTLDTMGVNESSLFPDLDGLSKHLNWQFWG